MYPVTSRFLDAISKSGRRKTVVDIYYNGIPIESAIPVIDGVVTLDSNADCRLSGNITVNVEDFDFTLLEPWGTELVIRSGVAYHDLTEELVPMGVLRIQVDSFTESSRTAPAIEGLDRSRALIDTQTGFDLDLSGRTSQESLRFLIDQSVPLASTIFGVGVGDLVLPGGSIFQNTYWDIAKEIATGIGCEIFFDRIGDAMIQIRPAVSSTTTAADAVWSIGTGQDGVLIDATRGSSRENTFSGVTIYGAETDDQVQPVGAAYDDNPSSRTYYFGPFGRKMLRLTNNTLTTNSQCYDAARQKLKEVTGLAKSVSFECLANPALDPGDIVLMEFFDGSELHLIDTLNIPLTGGKMTGTTKAVQYVA